MLKDLIREGNVDTPVTGPAAWTGETFKNDSSWLHVLDDQQIRELRAGVRRWNGQEIFTHLRTLRIFCKPLPLVEKTKSEIAAVGS